MSLNKNNKNSKKNEIINLNPVFVIPEEKNYNIVNFNSFFLYLFFIFEIIIVVIILFYFFKKEIIFVYKNLFFNEGYTNEEKKIYNNNLYKIKKLIEEPKFCNFLPSLIYNNVEIKEKYFPIYKKNLIMIALNDDIIYFNTEKECKTFLNIN